MTIKDETNDGVAIIRIYGRMTGGPEATAFLVKIREYLVQGVKKIIIDLSAVEWLSEVGLGMLVATLTTVKNNQGELFLSGPTKQIQRVLAITRLNTIFEVCDSIDGALASFNKTNIVQ